MAKKIKSLITLKYNQAFLTRVVKYATNKTEFNEVETITITNLGNGQFRLWIQNSRHGLTVNRTMTKNEVLDFIEKTENDMRKWKITHIP